jgi:hypothetical protein
LNKIILKKTTSAIFLAIVLLAGTFAVISPSFIIGIQAQSEPYYEMENRYNSYEPEREYENSNSYGPEYLPEYKDIDYNGYEPDYAIDIYEKSNQNDYNEQPEYPSYKPDYKPEYPKYGKDIATNQKIIAKV